MVAIPIKRLNCDSPRKGKRSKRELLQQLKGRENEREEEKDGKGKKKEKKERKKERDHKLNVKELISV